MAKVRRDYTVGCALSAEEKARLVALAKQEGLPQADILRLLIRLGPLLLSFHSAGAGSPLSSEHAHRGAAFPVSLSLYPHDRAQRG